MFPTWTSTYERAYTNRNTAPFRRVISSARAPWSDSWIIDTLACGHTFQRLELSAKLRRRCRQCT